MQSGLRSIRYPQVNIFVPFILLTIFLVNGGYSDWGPYGVCSKSCGGGKQTRKRTCTNPPPSNGGEDCSGLGPNSYTRECRNQECPGNNGQITSVKFDKVTTSDPSYPSHEESNDQNSSDVRCNTALNI